MSNQGEKPRKLKKRRATATVGGTTQSGFASRSMSDLMKQGGSKPADEPAQTHTKTRRKKGDPEEDAQG